MVSLSNHCTAHGNFEQDVASPAQRRRETAHFIADKHQQLLRGVILFMVDRMRVLLNADNLELLFFESPNETHRSLVIFPRNYLLSPKCSFCDFLYRTTKAIKRAWRISGKINTRNPNSVRCPKNGAPIVCTADVVE